MCCFVMNCYSQNAIIDIGRFELLTANHAMRVVSEKQFQNDAKAMKSNLDKINENYLKVVAAKAVITEALFNVNSALKNAKSVQYIAEQVLQINKNAQDLIKICANNPEYTHLARKYVDNIIVQCAGLQADVSKLALSGANNIMMNYHERDGIIRDVSVRLSLINSNLTLITRSIKKAKSIGWLKGATPFGNWINQDRRIVEDIIRRSKFF